MMMMMVSTMIVFMMMKMGEVSSAAVSVSPKRVQQMEESFIHNAHSALSLSPSASSHYHLQPSSHYHLQNLAVTFTLRTLKSLSLSLSRPLCTQLQFPINLCASQENLLLWRLFFHNITSLWEGIGKDKGLVIISAKKIWNILRNQKF